MQQKEIVMEQEKYIFTVSDITNMVKELLESLPKITVEGEISNFHPSSTGHWYFTLKDTRSALSAVMFKNRLFHVNLKPANGQRVRVTGSLSVYAQRGTYQIICDTITKVGTGDILEMLERRKLLLRNEGLFDSAHKRPIPRLPKRVVVITSPTGAAVRDILQVIRRRNAGIEVTILPAAVQGDQAAASLTRMLALADRHHLGDVIIIGRGGGSVEDLLPFSDEQLVRAVAASTTPVISAVGHETDWSLTDYAADLRAPTPSAAAELVTSEIDTIAEQIRSSKELLRVHLTHTLENLRVRIDQQSGKILEDTLLHRFTTLHLQINDYHEQITNQAKTTLSSLRHTLDLTTQDLHNSSPRALLKRGYAMIIDSSTGKRITSIEETSAGMQTKTILTDGSFTSTITGVT